MGDINLLSKGYSEVAEQSLSPQRSSRGPSTAPSPAPEGAVAAADAETVAQLQASVADEPAAGAYGLRHNEHAAAHTESGSSSAAASSTGFAT